jgi:hypothetical protein
MSVGLRWSAFARPFVMECDGASGMRSSVIVFLSVATRSFTETPSSDVCRNVSYLAQDGRRSHTP